MDHYLEIKAIPDPELLQSAVVGQLMQVLHGLLPAFCGRIGLSFPGYGQVRTLGGILRLHGTSEDLDQLAFRLKVLPIISSYALVTPIAKVPSMLKGHARFQRLHVKGESDRRRMEARHKARGTWTVELAQAIAEKYQQAIVCPHVILRSQSTEQPRVPLFVEKFNAREPVAGEFSGYGLSKTATVPWF
ncbi:MAG: CRISPR-associated endonuclease Csy4 [Zhongshania aliphaticivorans]|jgi:CRISPR-associated endonuclease Csy4